MRPEHAGDCPQPIALLSDSHLGVAMHAEVMGDEPILICYDGSASAERAIATAGRLFRERKAVVLDVVPLQEVAGAYAATGSDAAALDRLTLHTAATRARVGAELARAAGLRARGRVELEAPTWLGISDVADGISAAAIVIGSRGLNGMKALVEGSASHQVATHVGRPILIVPPPA
jgi:nucleotide-binding universal stress UspA family protein